MQHCMYAQGVYGNSPATSEAIQHFVTALSNLPLLHTLIVQHYTGSDAAKKALGRLPALR